MIENRLADLLGARKKKISTVARETGISRTTLTAMYYGTSNGVTFDVLDKLCLNLSCTPGDLLHMREVKENA